MKILPMVSGYTQGQKKEQRNTRNMQYAGCGQMDKTAPESTRQKMLGVINPIREHPQVNHKRDRQKAGLNVRRNE